MSRQTAQPPSVQSTIIAIESFFQPALINRNGNESISHRLLKPRPLDDESRVELLDRAGNLLQSLHNALKYEQAQTHGQAYDSSLLLALYKLIDFLLLDGLYPSLSQDVGMLKERWSKSLFHRKSDPSYMPIDGSDQTRLVLLQIFDPVLKDFDEGVEPLVRHRALSDVIAGHAWLAHAQELPTFISSFSSYLSRIPTASLFASYTALLQSSQVGWYRSMISEQLSGLPLRPGGVRSTIEFIASSHRPPASQSSGDASQPSLGPTLPLEALQQASKLLSSVPRAMTPDSYFAKLAPQLLELLDRRDEVALRKASAFIIGNGILGKRSIGAPSTIGWKLFVEPIFQAINPEKLPREYETTSRIGSNVMEDTSLISQADLELALRRLSTLIMSHPAPGLTGRLIRPLLVPLCTLASYRGSTYAITEMAKTAFALVRQFLDLVGTAQNLQYLCDALPWDSGMEWDLVLDEAGRTSVRRTGMENLDAMDDENLERDLNRIDDQVQTFCRLLNTSKIGDSGLSALFQYLFTKQLGAKKQPTDLTGEDLNLLNQLARIKLLESLIDKFSDRLVRNADELFDLIDRILSQTTEKIRTSQRDNLGPSIASLATITRQTADVEGPGNFDSYQDTLLIISSLLNTFSASPEAIVTTGVRMKAQAIIEHLTEVQRFANHDQASSMQLESTVALLRTKLSLDINNNAQVDAGTVVDVQNTLDLITIDIVSDLPPIRRSALHALQAIIKSSDAPLDVPPITLLLLQLIRTDKEEFVYLAAIQATVQLALRRNLGFVVRTLIDSFQDSQERTGVDGRLRIGQALATLVDELAEVDVGPVLQTDVALAMTESLLAVSARRGQRKRELIEREQEQRLRRRKHKEAARAWGGDVPDAPVDEDEEFEALTSLEKEKRLRDLDAIESIVVGWTDTGYEEDVRIRASALSILSRLFENCAHILEATPATSDTIELCLSILYLELEPAKAILRRAAALVLFGMLKNVDARLENGNTTGATPLVAGEEWPKVEKVLRWVVDTDEDELTVGHCEAVLEGLKAVRMKIIAGAAESASQVDNLEGNLRGLDIESGLGSNASTRSKIQEID